MKALYMGVSFLGLAFSSMSQASIINICDRGKIGQAIAEQIVPIANADCRQVDSEKMAGLKRLTVGSRQIKNLSPNAFSGLDSLTDLDLSNNLLEEIPVKAIQSIRYLSVLNLRNNRIHSILPDSFVGLNSLRSLVIGGDFVKIPSSSFAPLSKLKSLILESALLEEIPTESFRPLRTLTSLNIASPKIAFIPNYAFQPLSSLEWLYISGNHTNHVPPGLKSKLCKIFPEAFSGLSNLMRLNIDFTSLKEVPTQSFSSLPQLRQLSMSRNLIFEIGPGAFRGLKSLNSLSYIFDGELKSISHKAFESLNSVKAISLYFAYGLRHLPFGLFRETSNLDSLSLPSQLNVVSRRYIGIGSKVNVTGVRVLP